MAYLIHNCKTRVVLVNNGICEQSIDNNQWAWLLGDAKLKVSIRQHFFRGTIVIEILIDDMGCDKVFPKISHFDANVSLVACLLFD
jgi:hypothetical protein